MKRECEWGQDDPVSQLRVILGSIEGDLLNIQDKIVTEKSIPRALRHIKDAQRLAEAVTKGDLCWDP